MRVLIVHSRYLSGVASGENRVVEDEARLLRQGGHVVDVWVPEPESKSIAGRAKLGPRTVWSRSAQRETTNRIRALRAEIVHVHNLFPELSPSVIRTAHAEGARVVMSLHNYRLFCLPATLLHQGRICEDCVGRLPWRGVVRRTYRHSFPASAALATSLVLHRAAGTLNRVDRFLPVSRFVAEKYVEAGFDRKRMRVKPNFAWPAAPRQGTREYYLYLGRLASEKGPETLISLWSGVERRLVVAGDGPEADALSAAAPPNVQFVGSVAGERAAELLAGARAVLVPSRWYEPCPRVVIEAYAAGVPVVASRLGGLPELVDDGVTGYLIDPYARGEWLGALERLEDARTHATLGEAAHARWRDLFSPERALKALEESYREPV